jgi:hypothetical protein
LGFLQGAGDKEKSSCFYYKVYQIPQNISVSKNKSLIISQTIGFFLEKPWDLNEVHCYTFNILLGSFEENSRYGHPSSS